jgi:hypothetical protein
VDPHNPESNPFESLGATHRDRIPQPKTAAQIAYSVTGFLVMGLGGVLILVFCLMDTPRRGFVVAGFAVCTAGYWLFIQGRPPRERGPIERKPSDRNRSVWDELAGK